MTHVLSRSYYADYLASAIREESPWILEMRAGISLLATRNLKVEGRPARIGFIIYLGPSPDRPRVGRVDPIILIKEKDEWRVVDSIWTLGRLAGGNVASAFAQNPLMLLDRSTAKKILGEILPKIRETNITKEEFVSELLSHAIESTSIIGERPSEEIQRILMAIIPYLYAKEIDIRGKLNILLGGWTVEEFRKQFSIGLEVVRILEEEAQKKYDNFNQLVRIDEFISLREEDISLIGKEANVSHRISLGWIFYSLGRRPTGETFTREYYNELGKRELEEWIDPQNVDEWKEIMLKVVKEIIEEWISNKNSLLEREPEADFRSSTLDRMVRSFYGEESKISGSLEGFF